MPDLYSNILSFTKYKDVCFFCQSKLKNRLINFVGLASNDLPLINTHFSSDDKEIEFNIHHTTPAYEIKASGSINLINNCLNFHIEKGAGPTPYIDLALARSSFINMSPHIQLYCSSKKCKYQYTIASANFGYGDYSNGIAIHPFPLFYESFVVGNLWVQNDYLKNQTNIFSLTRETKPLTISLIDWHSMSVDKLLNRIKTIVIFS